MRNKLVYDLPTRLFHWIFAGLFIFAFAIAKNIDDELSTFSYHMLAGLVLGFTVVLRFIWGFVGTKYARFSSFALAPKDLFTYFKGIRSGDKRKWAGHNPASSWASLIMMALALGMGITGYLMTTGNKETFEDLHELLANGFLVIVLLHIAGVILHAFRHRDGIALTMIDGAKGHLPQVESISSPRRGVAILFIGLITTFSIYLVNQFNSQQRTLNLFGNTLQLGESEGHEKGPNDD